MKYKTRSNHVNNPLRNLEAFIRRTPPDILGRLVAEYICESNHMGWEFPRRDISGIRKFAEDLLTYYHARIHDNAAAFRTDGYFQRNVNRGKENNT